MMKRILSIFVLLLCFGFGYTQTVYPIVADTVKIKTPPVHAASDVYVKIFGNISFKRGNVDTIYFPDGTFQITALTATRLSNWNTAYSWGDWHSSVAPKWDSIVAKAYIVGTYVPLIRTINGYPLSSDVTLNKSDVGLSNVPNVDATNPANISQSPSYRFATDAEKATWNAKEPAIALGNTSDYYRGDKTFQPLNKAAVGLSNVNNTSDVNKPVSIATQSALNLKFNLTDTASAFLAYKLKDIEHDAAIATKQPTLVSGTNIKTINSISLLGAGDISVSSVIGFTPENVANKAVDFTVLNNTRYPSVSAVKTLVDASVANGNTAYSWGNHASFGYLTSYTETDPTIYAWAKAATKPSYGWTEIGSRPTLLSQFTNDLGNYGGFLTTETDPIYTASSWYTTTNNSSNWNTAYSDRLKWDGGATGLVAATGRASLGLVIGTDVLAFRTFGSAANNNTGDFYATSSTVANSTLWAGMPYLGVISTGPIYAMVYNGATSDWRPIGASGLATFLSGQTMNISGSSTIATYAENSSKLFSTDAGYAYGSAAPYYANLSYNGTLNQWEFKMNPATPSTIWVARAGNATTATNVAASGITGGHSLGLVDDTNVTLSQSGSGLPTLIGANTISVGWTGTLADSRIASASNWNAAYSWGNHAGLYYASGSTVANSILWNGYAINLVSYGSNAGDFLNYDNSLGTIKPFSTAQIQTKLGLSTMAYESSTNYYTKTNIQNYFSGASAMTGYNKSNWDAAYGWGNHSGLYQPLDGDLTAISALNTTSFGRSLLTLADAASAPTWNQNTSGNAASATLWNGLSYYGGALAGSVGFTMVYDGVNNRQGVASASQMASFLSGQTMNIAGYATSETLATVTGRGNITSTTSWFNNGIGFDQAGVRSWTLAAGAGNLTLGSGDGGGAFNVTTNINVSGRGFYNKSGQIDYTTAALEVYTADGAASEVGISFHRGGYSAGFLSHGSYGGLRWNGDKLLMSSMSSVAPTASSLVLRDGSGYVEGVYFRSTNTGTQGTGLAAITGKYITGDGYMYEFNAAAVRAFLSLPSVNDDLQAVTVRGASTNIASYFNNGAYASNFGVGEMSYTSNQLYRASANEMYLNYSGTGQTIIGNSAGITLNAATTINGTIYANSNIYLGDYLFLNNKLALRGTDSYLRLNQNGEFSSGIYTPYNLRVEGTTTFGSGAYYANGSTANLPPTTINGSATVNGYVYPYAIVNQSSVGADNGFGLFFGTYAEGSDYVIRRRPGAWSTPYQPLDIKFYTGIRLGADAAYGGTIFYNSSNLATSLFSVGNSDNNVRLEYPGQKLITKNPGSGIDVEALQTNYFGYSSGYAVLQVGDTRANRSIAFGVDLTGNPSGSFSGGGSEYIWRNVGSFKTPNSSNNGYNTLYAWNSSGQVTFSESLYSNGNIVASGDIYLGARSAWLSAWVNQALKTTDAPTFANVTAANFYGNATSATSTTLLGALGNYVWNNASAPTTYQFGVQASFVSASQSFPNYGSVLTVQTYSGGGGTLQLFTPYGDGYGGTSLMFRNGNYPADAFTAWKTIIDNTTIGAQSVTYATNSSKLYSTDAGYAYGSGAPYYGYLTYNNTRNHWEFKVSPATPSDVWVSRSGTADNSLQLGGYDANTYLGKFGNTYYQQNNWIQVNGGYGLYWPAANYTTNYGSTYVQINPNYGTTPYGSLTIYGRQNSYAGITFGDGGNSTLMYDASGNGGGYTPSSGWHYYWSNSSQLLGLGGSTVVAGFKVTSNGSLYVGGKVTATQEINSGGNIYTAANYGYGLVGLYDSYKFQGVYAMGDAYKVAYDGSTPGNLYGISWVHSNAGGQAALISGHHMLVMANGLTQTAIGSGIWTNGAVTATAFYQSSDIRLKNVISQVGDMIIYTWKDQRDKLVHYGYSAQEKEINYSYQVSTSTDGIKSVNYIEIHTKKINDLEIEVSELKILINQLLNKQQKQL